MAVPSNYWDETDPTDIGDVSLGDDKFRNLQAAIRERVEQEHQFTNPGYADKDGEHLEGSARAYYRGTTPPKADLGRLWFDTASGQLKIGNGTDWDVPDLGGNSAGGVPTGTMVPFAGSSIPAGWVKCEGQALSRTTYAALFAVIGVTYGSGDGSTTFNIPDMRGRVAIGPGSGSVAETRPYTDISTSNDTMAVSANNTKWITGMAVVFSTDGAAPTNLPAGTYYLIRESSTTVRFATSLANALAGTYVDIQSQGTGNHTITYSLTTRSAGEIGGEESHALTEDELPSTEATMGTKWQADGNTSGNSWWGALPTEAAGDQAHNNMPPFLATNYIIKYTSTVA